MAEKIDVERETAAFRERVITDLEAEVQTHRAQIENLTRLLSYWQREAARCHESCERLMVPPVQHDGQERADG